jgi:hypothetical protein
LEKKGHLAQLHAATVFVLEKDGIKGLEAVIPFTREAHLGFVQFGDQSSARARIASKNGKRYTILEVGKPDRVIRILNNPGKKRVFQQLRKHPRYKEFEEELARRGRVVLEEKIAIALDVMRKKVFIPILTALESSSSTPNVFAVSLPSPDELGLTPDEYSGVAVSDLSDLGSLELDGGSTDIVKFDPGSCCGGGGQGPGEQQPGFLQCLRDCVLGEDPIQGAIDLALCLSSCGSCAVGSFPSCVGCALCLGKYGRCVWTCLQSG